MYQFHVPSFQMKYMNFKNDNELNLKLSLICLIFFIIGKHVTFELPATRTLQFENMTIQENGVLNFHTQYGNNADFYDINVCSVYYKTNWETIMYQILILVLRNHTIG